MDRWIQNFIGRFRDYRTSKLATIGRFFLQRGISANAMTALSFFFGLGAVYFLFASHLYFVILGLLHLFADGLDGVIARVSTPTAFGKYFDYLSDQLIALLFILKISWFLHDYYPLIIAMLYFTTHFIYTLSHFTAPILYSRTVLMIILLFPFSFVPTVAYLTAGVISLYALTLQVSHYSQRW